MLRPQLILDLHRELIVDNFAGGGGASTGIEMALGRHVDHAVNHDWAALGMHRINHAQSVHHCEDVFDVDPARLTEGRPVGLGWFSPDCKHFSKAKGGKPLSKKIRGLAFVILRWAQIGTRVIYMENVEEIKTWGPLLPDAKPDKAHTGRTWRAFLDAIGPGVDPAHPDLDEMLEVLGDSVTREELVRGFGYRVETRELRACDYGAPTIRKRLFLIARCDGAPIVWPKPTHAAPEVARKLKLRPYRAIAECIDWHLPCHSIFLSPDQARAVKCRRPLAPATLRRIAKGVDRYVLRAKRPFLVSLTHQGGERVESVDEPARTLTAAHRGEKAVCDAQIAPFVSEHANASAQRNMPCDEPGRTQCAEIKGGHFSLVAGTLIGAGGPAYGGKPKPIDKPLGTMTTENHSCLAQASLVSGSVVGAGGRAAQSRPRGIDEPLHTTTAKGDSCIASVHLCREFGESVGQSAAAPAPTVMPAGQGKTSLISGTLVQTGYGERPGQQPRAPGIEKPLGTVVAGGGKHAVVAAHLTRYNSSHEGRDDGANRGQSPESPISTQDTSNRHGIVGANMIKLRGDPETHPSAKPADEAVDTISAAGQHHGLSVAYLAQHNAGNCTNPGHPASEPVSTISNKGAQQQVVVGNLAAYYGNDKDGQAMDEPCRTVTTKERFGFCRSEAVSPGLTPEQLDGARRVAAFLRAHGVAFDGEFATVAGYVIVDLGMRMLTPRELFRAQGFPAAYVIDRAWVVDPKTGAIKETLLTKEQQIRMCGNSVCPPIVAALVRANSGELAIGPSSAGRKGEARKRRLAPC